MQTTVETTAAQSAAAIAAAKAQDEEADGDVFVAELEAQLAKNQPQSTADKVTSTMERLAQALSGVAVSRGSAPSMEESPGYFLKTSEFSQVTISDEMLAQMADDPEMFAKVKDMVSGLVAAGQSQSLSPVAGRSTATWQNIVVGAESTRVVEVNRGTGGSSISSLAFSTQEIVNSALDLLLNNRQSQGQSSGSSSSAQSSGLTGLVSNTTSWRLEMSFSSTSTAQQALQASRDFVSRLDIMIEQIEVGGSSGADIFSYMQIMGLSDPLVFDLGGEGINLTSAEDGVYFDIKGDGSPVRTAWITGNNAFLYLDENGNGLADDANELFGDHGGHANGFEKLRQYDSNGDGVIDSEDEIYSQLRLWRDLNQDGVNQANESLTLAQAGIRSINLGYDDNLSFDGKGNVIGERSYFTRTDGSTGEVADAWLKSLS